MLFCFKDIFHNVMYIRIFSHQLCSITIDITLQIRKSKVTFFLEDPVHHSHPPLNDDEKLVRCPDFNGNQDSALSCPPACLLPDLEIEEEIFNFYEISDFVLVKYNMKYNNLYGRQCPSTFQVFKFALKKFVYF